MAPHSSTLTWKIPWMEEPGGLQSMGSQRVRHGWATSLSLFTLTHWRRKWQPTPVFLPEESQGQRAWWAAVYGITQSRTRLKRLSSSNSSRLCYPPAQSAPKWFTLKINPQPTRTLDLARAHPYILLSDPPVTLTLYYIIRTVSAPHLAPRGLRDFSFPESSPSGILVVGTPCPSFPGFLRCCLLFVF